MAQILSKVYKCYRCEQPVLLSKLDKPDGKRNWQQWELDKQTIHICGKPQKDNNNKQEASRLPASGEEDSRGTELRALQQAMSKVNEIVERIIVKQKNL
jgi:hypothetical protein